MSSLWERFGEHIGYGLAAVVLGPHAAFERRARRAMRAAMVTWCAPLRPEKLDAPRGKLRRRAELPAPGGSLAIDVVLDLARREARITLPLERRSNAATSQALIEAISSGPLQHLAAFAITLGPKSFELLAAAPSTPEGWAAMGDGALSVVAWLTQRWPASYRS